MTRASECQWEAEHSTIFVQIVWQSKVAIFARKFGCMHLACLFRTAINNKSTRMRILLFRRRKSFIFISCSSDWLYANEFVLGVRNCRGKKNFAGGGGGGRGATPPPPIMLFQSFVGTFRNLSLHHTCKPTSMSFVPTKYLKYQQNIERNFCSFRMSKCEKIF